MTIGTKTMAARTISMSGLLRVLGAAALVLGTMPVGMRADAQRADNAPERRGPAGGGEPGAQSTEIRRTADGQPDITGTWRAVEGGTYDMTAVISGGAIFQWLLDRDAGRPVAARPSRVIDPADGKIPYLPWARAHQQEIERNADNPRKREHIDPRARCLPGGTPREVFPTGFKFVQAPGYVLFLGGQKSVSRLIPLDGRPHLGEDIKLWMGSSRGRWEGNTLVVDVRNQNSKGRFDMVGNFASDRVRVTERWTIVDANTIEYTALLDDPTVYARPWTLGARIVRATPRGGDVHADEYWEDACHEGERSAEHMVLTPDQVVPATPGAGQ
jgi:hypothetical protein